MGIGRPQGQQDPADFVLKQFASAEKKELPEFISRCAFNNLIKLPASEPISRCSAGKYECFSSIICKVEDSILSVLSWSISLCIKVIYEY
jgi:hypothetical protein